MQTESETVIASKAHFQDGQWGEPGWGWAPDNKERESEAEQAKISARRLQQLGEECWHFDLCRLCGEDTEGTAQGSYGGKIKTTPD